jgi:glycosyltransferase involved in cell wall biosynthesis
MTIKHAIASIRRYGLRGVIDFLKRVPRQNAISRRLAKSIDPNLQPQPGITIVGALSQYSSPSKVLRDFVIRLRECGIPCQAFDTNDGKKIPESEYAHLLTSASEFRLNRYTDIIGMFTLPPLPPTSCRLSRIVFWEFESGLLEGNPEFYEPVEVVTMSDFAQTIFRRQVTTTPVTKILYPFTFKPWHLIDPSEMRTRYGLGANDFVVFYNFSYASSYYRKNPDGAVRAFAEAFKNCADAKLVFKTNGAKDCANSDVRLKALIASLGLSDRVVFVAGFLEQYEIVSLTNACDVYLSLHRGEGFGLGIAEAMSLGKPVVVTNYSAPTEFCNADNAMLVPYSMRAVKPNENDIGVYAYVKEWAEPDVHAAATDLRRLYDDRAFAKELGENGRRFIADHFSDANFKKSVEAFLARG